MTFDEIFEQVIAILKRQGRVSYRALKRRFDLDDAYIEDLKAEILYVHPVVDDEGVGLIWSGEAEAKPEPESSPQPAQTLDRAVTEPVRATQPEPLTSDAERRQFTVMFCDLADSTKLSGQVSRSHSPPYERT